MWRIEHAIIGLVIVGLAMPLGACQRQSEPIKEVGAVVCEPVVMVVTHGPDDQVTVEHVGHTSMDVNRSWTFIDDFKLLKSLRLPVPPNLP